jgi:hypothetical protein
MGLGGGCRCVLGQPVAILAGLGVLPPIDAQVTPLAGGYDVVGVLAWWVAGAEVGDGESNRAVGVLGLGVVALSAPSPLVGASVESALACALALSTRPDVANVAAESVPAWSVLAQVTRHGG